MNTVFEVSDKATVNWDALEGQFSTTLPPQEDVAGAWHDGYYGEPDLSEGREPVRRRPTPAVAVYAGTTVVEQAIIGPDPTGDPNRRHVAAFNAAL